jgi:hypothetical protein
MRMAEKLSTKERVSPELGGGVPRLRWNGTDRKVHSRRLGSRRLSRHKGEGK